MISAVMPRLALWLAATLLAAPTLAAGAEALQPWTGGPPPPLKLRTLAGAEVDLATYRGRTVVVNFWATWCAPCAAEMPSLQRLHDKLAPDGVDVLAVNLQENAARIAPFLRQYGIGFPVVRDHDGSVRTAWGVNVFPTSFVVGPDQRITWWGRGEVDWDDARVESRVRPVR